MRRVVAFVWCVGHSVALRVHYLGGHESPRSWHLGYLGGGHGACMVRGLMDPIYEFKPGEGWVPACQVITMACGTRVRWEKRAPTKDGERYRAYFAHRTLEECLDFLMRNTITMGVWESYWMEVEADRQYFVVVPCE